MRPVFNVKLLFLFLLLITTSSLAFATVPSGTPEMLFDYSTNATLVNNGVADKYYYIPFDWNEWNNSYVNITINSVTLASFGGGLSTLFSDTAPAYNHLASFTYFWDDFASTSNTQAGFAYNDAVSGNVNTNYYLQEGTTYIFNLYKIGTTIHYDIYDTNYNLLDQVNFTDTDVNNFNYIFLGGSTSTNDGGTITPNVYGDTLEVYGFRDSGHLNMTYSEFYTFNDVTESAGPYVGEWIVTGYDTDENDALISVSSDSENWFYEPYNFSNMFIRGMSYSPKLEQYILYGSSSYIGTSTDRLTWTQQSQARDLFDDPITGSFYDVIWVDELELWIASGKEFIIASSQDGVTWQNISQNFSPDTFGSVPAVAWSPELEQLAAVTFSGELAVSTNTTGFVVKSNDISTYRDVAWSSNLSQWVAVGSGGMLQTSTDGQSWVVWPSSFGSTLIASVGWSPDLGQWVIGGADGKIATSTDGQSWTQRTSPFSSSELIYDVEWSPVLQEWLAIGEDGEIATSSNGITWTLESSLPEYDILSDVMWLYIPPPSENFVYYLDTLSYTNTSYQECLDTPGNDLYNCHSTQYYSDWESRGYPVLYAGAQDTGMLSTSLDLGRNQNDNTDYLRKEFGGQSTETIIQEDADTVNIVPQYLYVDYTKPPGADRQLTQWRFKHGHNGTDVLDEYITIPQACWDANGLRGDIQLRVYSSGYDVFTNETSYGECYDGSSWIKISQDINGSANYGSFFTADGADRLTDGNYTWGANWRADINDWYWAGNSYSKIYEEAMHWYVEGIDPEVHFWFDGTENLQTIENYYIRFWQYDELNNETTTFDYSALFKWGESVSYWNESWMSPEDQWLYKYDMYVDSYRPLVNFTFEEHIDFGSLITSGELDQDSIRVRNQDTGEFYETTVLHWDEPEKATIQWFVNNTLSKDTTHNMSVYFSTLESGIKDSVVSTNIQDEYFFCFGGDAEKYIDYSKNTFSRTLPTSWSQWAGQSASDENEEATIADFNNDGNLDIAFVTGTTDGADGSLHVWISDGGNDPSTWTETYVEASTHDWSGVVSADFNEDGYVDIFAMGGSTTNGYPYLYTNDGDNTFTRGASLGTLSGQPRKCAVADFDNDDNMDVVCGANTNTLEYFGGNGDGTFDTMVPVSNSPADDWHGVGTVDANQDGCMDLITMPESLNPFYYQGQCDGTFGNGINLNGNLGDRGQGNDQWGQFNSYDVDNDGVMDLISGTWGSTDMQVYWGNESRLAAGGTTPSLWGDLSGTSGTEYSETTININRGMDCTLLAPNYKDFNVNRVLSQDTSDPNYIEEFVEGFFDVDGTKLNSSNINGTSNTILFDSENNASLKYGYKELSESLTIPYGELERFGLMISGEGVNTLFDKYRSGMIIFNLPNVTTLNSTDSDGDGITDYDELYIYYTNPYQIDTDEGGRTDYLEIQEGTNPNIFEDDKIIVNELYATPSELYPGNEIACNFNLTNNDPYSKLDVTVTWKTSSDNNTYENILYNNSYLSKLYSTGQVENNISSYTYVDAPTELMFTDSGCSVNGGRHAGTTCTKTIPVTTDLQLVEYVVGYISTGDCGSRDGYVRFNYADATTYTTPRQGLGTRTFTNPNPEKEVTSLYINARTTNGCTDDSPYARFQNVRFYGPLLSDGPDTNLNKNVFEHEFNSPIDRFYVDGDIDGGSTRIYYSTEEPNYLEDHVVMYQDYEMCNSIGCALDNSRFSNNNIDSSDVFQLENNSNEYNYNFTLNTSFVEINDYYQNLPVLNDSYLENLRMLNGGTICTEARPEVLGNVSYLVDKSNGINGTNGYTFKVETDGSLSFIVNNGDVSTSSPILNSSEMNFVCVAFDSTGRKFYSNGVDITNNGSQTTLPSNTTHNLIIGNDYSKTNAFIGEIDNTLFFDIKLTPEQVMDVSSKISNNTFDIYEQFTEFKYQEVVNLEQKDYMRLLQTFRGTDGKVNNMTLFYHTLTSFAEDGAYNHTFVDVDQNQLYTTSVGSGSYTGTINPNEQYICEITIDNQYEKTVDTSLKEDYYPIFDLNITAPVNNTATDNKLVTNFSVVDYEGSIGCYLQDAGSVVGSLPYSLSGTQSVSGTQKVFHYTVSRMDMTAGCNGEVSLAPNNDYDLEMCLQDVDGNDVPGSCKIYESGEYGVGDTLSTGKINVSYLENGEEYRIKLNWNRIGYVSMDNPLLDGNYDHGGVAKGTTNNQCVAYWSVTNNICGDEVDDFKFATSQAACEISDLNTLVEQDRKYYSDFSCGSNATLITNDIDFNYYADSPERRVYEGYYRTGGTPASMTCEQANSAIDIFDCGTCLTEANAGMSSEIWIPKGCSDGVEDDVPANLCTNIENATDYSDYFTYTTSGDADGIRFTDKLVANGNITWTSTSEDNSWPYIEGEYNWNILCNSTSPIQSLESETLTYYYDLTAPSITNYVSDQTALTPEIGDTIMFSADVTDSFGVNYCELLINDLDKWEVVDNDTINANTGVTNLDFSVRPYSIRDAETNPSYFRTGETVWTKLSMEAGETIVITISDNENIYDLYEDEPANVFEFYEGFDGSSLNSSVWFGVSDESSTVDVSSGIVTFLDDDSDNADYYETYQKFSRPSIIEWRARDDTAEDWPIEVGFGHGTSNTIGKIKDIGANDFYLFKSYDNGVPNDNGTFAAINAYENFRVVWKENTSQLYRDESVIANLSRSPYVDSGVAFGDLTAGGADDSDTKGMIDWMFVRKYSENMPDISCTDNVCIIEANSGAFEDLQVPLTTTYLAGDIALAYVQDNTQVDWKIGCYDSSGTYAETPLQTFTVKDNTNPQIELGENNAFGDTNNSVISSALTNLELEVDYFDYNLFQAYEKITCEDSGVIYEWEDIDVELFNHDVISDRANNVTKAFDVYDDTYSEVLVGTTNGSGYIGQEFDSFYDVSSLDYKINTTDSNVKIQTFNGNGWTTLHEHARATTQHDNTLIINQTIKGIRYVFDDTTSSADVVQKVFFMKYVYNSGLANNGANFEHKSVVSLEGLPMQKCEFYATASDDHTANEIPDYIVNNIVNGLEYNTENDIVAQILYDGSTSSVEKVSTEKQNDRYIFTFDFNDFDTERTFTVSSENGHPIYPRGNSKYPGHLVIWNPEKRSGNWIDFNELGDAFKDYVIESVDNYNYKVTVKTDVPVDKLEFQSIGGTNTYNETWEFYIGGALNVTGHNIYDDTTFGNYTYDLRTISSTPGKNETSNPQTDQNYVTALSEGLYEITFTHPEYFTKTYTVNMTQQYQNNTANSADSTSFENISLWNNSGNLFDNNDSTYTTVNSTIYTYVYMNYTAPSSALDSTWVIDAFDEGPANIDLTYNDTTQLRIKVRNGTDNNDIIAQEYVSGNWIDLNYGNLTYTGKIAEERIEWEEEAPHLITLPYDTYQAAISFNVTDVKSREYLSDLNITMRNQVTGQNDTIVYPNGTFLDTFYVNADVVFEVDTQKPPYIRNIETLSFDNKQEETYTIEMPYYSTLNIVDEKTLLPFDFADPASVEFLVFCPDSTESYQLNATPIEVPITCDYDKFKFVLTYAGGTGYYRNLLVPHSDSFNQTIYLMDITDTPYVYTAFIIDDLMNRYENPSIWVKKAISEDVVVIQSDFTDIEDKTGTYLIENAEYIIEVHSDNNPIEVIGRYGADVGEDKIISMYDINLAGEPNGFFQNVDYTMKVVNQSGVTGVMFGYNDDEGKTNTLQFKIYQDRLNGTEIFSSEVYENVNSIGSLFVPLTGFENRTVAGEILINHQEVGNKEVSALLNKEWEIPLPLQKHVSEEFLNWFFVILLSVIAIMSSKGTSIPTIAVTGIALVLVLFEWFTLSLPLLVVAIMLGVFEAIKGRNRR